MRDTAPEVQAHYDALLARRTPEQRLRMMSDMYDCARQLARAGIRHRHPNASETEVRQKLFLQFYERDFTPDQVRRVLAYIASGRQDGGEI